MLVNILVVACGVLLLFFFLILPGESTMEDRKAFWGVCFAHRGLHSKDKAVPENSLAAFTAAVDEGYGIELDIQLTRDGRVVVFHDDTLDRVCGVSGRLDSYTWDELQAFSLCDTDQKIPLLREVLDLVDSAVPLVVELKMSGRNKELCQAAWRVLMTYDGEFCIESFDPRIVRWFKKHVPGILRGQLSARPKELKSGVAGFFVGNLLTNFYARPQFIAYQEGACSFPVRLAHRLAMRVAWTISPGNDPAVEEARIAMIESENDAVIFEHYRPEPRFKEPPEEFPTLGDDEYRF